MITANSTVVHHDIWKKESEVGNKYTQEKYVRTYPKTIVQQHSTVNEREREIEGGGGERS